MSICPSCGQVELRTSGTGRPQKWCSARCKRLARTREVAAKRAAGEYVGKCSKCLTRDPEPGKARCRQCRERQNESSKKRQALRKELGLCVQGCGNVLDVNSTQFCTRHLERRNEFANAYNRRLRIDAWMAYGGQYCSCCGEDEHHFLSLDHIEDNGAEQRRDLGLPSLYAWLKRNGYPPGFRVLCMNCNQGRYRNGGTCPHEENVRAFC